MEKNKATKKTGLLRAELTVIYVPLTRETEMDWWYSIEWMLDMYESYEREQRTKAKLTGAESVNG